MNKLLSKTILFGLLTFLAYLICYIFLDRTVAIWMHGISSAVGLARFKLLTSLGNGPLYLTLTSCALILVAVHDYIYSRSHWSQTILYLSLSVIIATTIGSAIKYLLARYRPIELFEHGRYGFHFLSFKWKYNSTPSGHTYRIFSLMTAIVLCYRRLLIPCMLIAIVVAISRVILTDHFPSDIIFGAYIGIIVASWTKYYFDRITTKEQL